jgi:xylitol oxidase
MEAALAPYEARPHWGKLFTTAPEQVRALYPRMDDFRALVAQADPEGVFGNTYLDTVLGG